MQYRREQTKPLIGIVPLVDVEKESYWMLPGYMEGITEAGGIPLMLPLTEDINVIEQMIGTLDGFLLTGGHDVSPKLYGEEKLPECGECCEMRDRMEEKLFLSALKADKPVFGICRGIQFMNAVLGGTLYQDIPTQYSTTTQHHMEPPYDRSVHSVSIVESTPLAKILSCEKINVNSYHHQAIKVLSNQLKPMAISEDGLVEAVYYPDKTFVIALQWHPEFSFKKDHHSRKILKAFVDATVSRERK